jgi:phytoene synthase
MTCPSYAEALKQVKTSVSASRTSFMAGMTILPRKRREAMYAFYAFCRAVDDIADESPSPEIAQRELQDWRLRISNLFKGSPSDFITTALAPAVGEFHLVEKDFQEIIDGMEMDSTDIVAPDAETLDLYCDRVASAVGRVSVRIFGTSSEEAMRVAHHLGRAFQLTNILRDLGEDAARKRVYLPRELLNKHGIDARAPQEVLKSPHLPKACIDLAAQTRQHYEQAAAFMEKCPRQAMRPARIMRDYYEAIFNALLKAGWQDSTARISLPRWKKLLLVLKGLLR